MLVFQLQARHLGFGVGHPHDDGLFVVVDGVHGPFAEVGAARDVGEDRLDFRLDGVHVHVAHHEHRLEVGAVPFVVEVAQRLVVEVLDDRRVAYHVAHGVLRAGIFLLVGLLPHAAVGSLAGAPFFEYHAALGVDFLGQQGDGVGPVVQHEQGGVDHALAHGGHVGRLYTVSSSEV